MLAVAAFVAALAAFVAAAFVTATLAAAFVAAAFVAAAAVFAVTVTIVIATAALAMVAFTVLVEAGATSIVTPTAAATGERQRAAHAEGEKCSCKKCRQA